MIYNTSIKSTHTPTGETKMLTKLEIKRQQIAEGVVAEIKKYAAKYNCSDIEAYRDWENDGPVDSWLLEITEETFKA
jgi:hypothetical protein|tara:strand:+ start:488 stop:718 length:231 start_codon:yes stop_codon:yes gene_type:complete